MDTTLMKGGFGTISLANMVPHSRVMMVFNELGDFFLNWFGQGATALAADNYGFTNAAGVVGRDPLVERTVGNAAAAIVFEDVIQQEEVGRNEPNVEWGCAPPK
jgi:hypothetical protein